MAAGDPLELQREVHPRHVLAEPRFQRFAVDSVRDGSLVTH